ncbi:hypothetical protein C0J52_13313, partial [Blattella germanica]
GSSIWSGHIPKLEDVEKNTAQLQPQTPSGHRENPGSGIWSGYTPNFENIMKNTAQSQPSTPSRHKEDQDAHICVKCGKIYKWRTSLIKHRRQECGKEPQFQCPYCPKRTKQKDPLMGQEYVLEIARGMGCSFGALDNNIGSTSQILACEDITSQELQQHMPGDHVCSKCGKRYRQYSSLWRHYTYECGKDPQFQCPYCPHRSTQKVSLKKHIWYTLMGQQCVLGIGSNMDCSFGALDNNIRSTSQILTYKDITSQVHELRVRVWHECPKCGKRYQHHTSLSRHLSFECGKDPQFQCPYCPLKLTQNADALMGQDYFINFGRGADCTFDALDINAGSTSHLLTYVDLTSQIQQQQEFPGDYVCLKCGKKYRQNSSLWRHNKFECGKDPQFQCPYCSDKLTQKSSLKKHIRSCHPELLKGIIGSWYSSGSFQLVLPSGRNISRKNLIPYSNKNELFPCTACGKVYQWKKTLLRHVRHECGKEPQFQCPYCPQRTTQKNSLKNHIRSRHPMNAVSV